MKKISFIAFVVFNFLLFLYLLYPLANFPEPPVDFVQSFEPADTETDLRRSYFTNMEREQIIEHYQNQLSYQPTLRLNYPPEEAQQYIRDQTRSTFLEELVHPLRSSVFINGFKPKEDKDVIRIDNQEYVQKITVRYIPSSTLDRLLLWVLIFMSNLLMIHLMKWLITSVKLLAQHSFKFLFHT